MKSKFFYTSILIFATLLLLRGKVYARITTSDPTVNSGENATITINSQENVASGAIDVVSDGGLKFVSVSGGTPNGTKVAFASAENKKNGIATYVFKTPEVTKTTQYKVTFESMDMSDAESKAIKSTPAIATVTVKPKEETKTEEKKTEETKKSDNANLKTLGVTPKEYDFSGFSKNKTSYSVTIPSNVDSLNVIAKAEDSKAKVNISGNKNLEVGTNTIKVEVTAENGKTTKTYEVNVTKLATEDEKPGNLLDDNTTTKLYLKSLSIDGLELTPSFDKNIFSYEATIDMDTKDLSNINVNAAAENLDSTVEITGNTDLKEGENTVNVIVKSKSSSEQTVYQITVNKVSKASEITTNKKKGIKRETLIIGLYIACLIIIFAILILKKTRNKKLNNDYQEVDENLDSSNNNLMDDIYKKKNNGEELNDFEKQTINDIESENDRIFKKNKNSILYNQQDDDSNDRKKGRHF